MKLKPNPPFNFDLTATHMYLMPPAKYTDGIFSRILRLESGRVVHISVTSSGSVDNPELSVLVEPRVSEDNEREIKEKLSFMFSMDNDLTEFYSIARNDPILKYAVENLYGIKIQTTPTLFEGLVISFCLQWVSFERGVKMIDCLIRRYGEKVNGYYTFPAPQALAEARIEELKRCKLGFRAERIKWISEKMAEGLNLEELKSLPDDRLREKLMKIKWVGEVTTEALLLWRFKRYSAFPVDVWSSKIIKAFYPELKDRTLDDMRKFTEDRWGEYRGLAYYYLICDRKNLAQRLGVELGLGWNS